MKLFLQAFLVDLVDLTVGHMGVHCAPLSKQFFAKFEVLPEVIVAPNGSHMTQVAPNRYEQTGPAPRGRYVLNLV